MLRAGLPWLFTALAVASPPSLYALFALWGDYNLDDTGRIFWFFYSLVLVAVFLTLAAATWSPESVAARAFKYAVLVPSGVASLLGGIGALFFAAMLERSDTLGIVVLLATGFFLMTTAANAFRQLLRNGSGEGRVR